MKTLKTYAFEVRAFQQLKALGIVFFVVSTSLEASRPRITITGDSIVRSGSDAVIDVTIQNVSPADILDSVVQFEGHDAELLKLVSVKCEGAGATLNSNNTSEAFIKRFIRNTKSTFKLMLKAGLLRPDEELKSFDLMVSIFSKRLKKTTVTKPVTIYTLKESA